MYKSGLRKKEKRRELWNKAMERKRENVCVDTRGRVDTRGDHEEEVMRRGHEEEVMRNGS